MPNTLVAIAPLPDDCIIEKKLLNNFRPKPLLGRTEFRKLSEFKLIYRLFQVVTSRISIEQINYWFARKIRNFQFQLNAVHKSSI